MAISANKAINPFLCLQVPGPHGEALVPAAPVGHHHHPVPRQEDDRAEEVQEDQGECVFGSLLLPQTRRFSDHQVSQVLAKKKISNSNKTKQIFVLYQV